MLRPLRDLLQPNSKVENGLHVDFHASTELDGQVSRNLEQREAGALKFLWNPRFERNFDDEIFSVFTDFRPEYVVLGAGLWFLAENKGRLGENLADFELNWRKILDEITKVYYMRNAYRAFYSVFV